MNPPSSNHLSERESYLMTLCALGELSPEERSEWIEISAKRPELAAIVDLWKNLAGEITDQSVTSALPQIPDIASKRMDAARHAYASRPRISAKGLGRRMALVGLPVAAMVALGFVFLHSHDDPSDADSFAMKSAPVTFPQGELKWQAPGKTTSQSRPVFIWKGTPGKTYNLRLENSVGKLLFYACSVQSPVIMENMLVKGDTPADLPAGSYLITIQETEGKAVDTHGFEVKEGASSAIVQGAAEEVLRTIETLHAQGSKEDALMLLMRLPEDAISVDEFRSWRKKLE